MSEKTFTQEQLDRIVQERLAREKENAAAEIEKRERELQRQELTLFAKMTLHEKGLPMELLDAMNISDKDTFLKSVELMEKLSISQRNTTHDPLIRDTIKKKLLSDGFSPMAVDLAVDSVNLETVQHENGAVKNLDEIVKTFRGKYSGFFGDTRTEGAQPANPPAFNNRPNEETEIRKAMGLKK